MSADEIRRVLRRNTALVNGYSDIKRDHMDLADHFTLRRSRFLTSDRDKSRKMTKLARSVGPWQARTLRDGLLAGNCPESQPWFRLGFEDPALNQNRAVKEWLKEVEGIIYRIFRTSNFYQASREVFWSEGVFGMCGVGISESFQTVARFTPFPIGSYRLATDENGNVSTIYRDVTMTVEQLIGRYGYKNVPGSVQSAYDSANYQATREVLHAIEPNFDSVKNSLNPADRAWKSMHIIVDGNHLLKKSGFDYRPFAAPRWAPIDDEVYSESPAMYALPDVKSIQNLTKRGANIVDRLDDPSMKAPTSLKKKASTTRPRGGITYVDENGGTPYSPIYIPEVAALQAIDSREERYLQDVNREMYTDLMMMMINSDRRQITAREVAERHDEKVMMLTATTEQQHKSWLVPAFEAVYEFAERGEVFPPPPDDIVGSELKIEFISILATAQKMLTREGYQEIVEFVGTVGQVKPHALKKIDEMELIDQYADTLGLDPRVIVPTDDIKEQIEAEEQAARNAQAMEQMAAMAPAAKAAGDIKTDERNVVTDIRDAMNG